MILPSPRKFTPMPQWVITSQEQLDEACEIIDLLLTQEPVLSTEDYAKVWRSEG